MRIVLKLTLVIGLVMLLNACGSSEHPAFTHVVVKSNERGVLLDTKDSDTLKEVHALFYDRKEANSAATDFFYLIDITTSEGSSRWQYSDEGYIRNFDSGSTAIFELVSVQAFNSIAGIK